MNELEYLLTCVSEEAVEISQRCTKAMRFGIDEVQPGQAFTNEERLWSKVTDLQGTLEKLIELRGGGNISRENVDAKKIRIDHFMRYSRSLGCLK